MNTNKILIGGLIGGIVAFALGYLVYGNLLMGFFEKNAGSATGVMKDPLVWWALGAGHLVWGLLLAVIFGRWAGIKTFATGAKAGAVIGLLISLSMNLIWYGTANLSTLTATLVDPIVAAVITGIVGGVVGWWFGRSDK